MSPPQLSVIIPAYNRVDLLLHTLASVRVAAEGFTAEVIVVDDGSSPPLATLLPPDVVSPLSLRVIAQPNSGSACARQLGLNAAAGTWINFLDSDDLVAPGKYRAQLAAMQAADADVSYTDQVERATHPDDPAAVLSEHTQVMPAVEDSTDLFLKLHPAPHNLVYHRRVLAPLLAKPWLQLRELYRPVGDIWTFYNLAPFPARFIYVPLPLTIYRVHPGERYSRRWEATGIASTGVMLEFMARCPSATLTSLARRRVAENAIDSLRRLPRGMPLPWEAVLWKIAGGVDCAGLGPLGGRWFEHARRWLGLKRAVALFRLLSRPRYQPSPSRVPAAELAALCRTLATLVTELDEEPRPMTGAGKFSPPPRNLKLLASRLGLGKLAYHLWHRPAGLVRTCIAEGGPVEQWRSSRGRAAMRSAATTLPTLSSSDDPGSHPVELHLLTGRRFWDQTAFCLWTFARHSGRRLAPVLYDDGTLDDASIAHLGRLFPGLRVITQSAAAANLARHLPPARYPFIHDRWKNYPNIRKLIDPHLGSAGWKLVIDSDLLFFRRPDCLLDWLDAPDRPLHAVDNETSYGYDRALMDRLAGARVADLVNVGLAGLRSDEIDWNRVEYFCRELITAAGTHYYLEQALVAMLVAGRPCTIAPAADYVTLPIPPEARDCSAVMHHYVAGSKPWYFRKNWRHALA